MPKHNLQIIAGRKPTSFKAVKQGVSKAIVTHLRGSYYTAKNLHFL
jgi:hypothetical protein